MPSLFDPPRARTTDPGTSHAAAHAIKDLAGRQRTLVARIVREHPGQTSADLAEHTDELDRYAIARRLPEAEKLGMVRKGDPKPSHTTGKQGVTWWPCGDLTDA